MIYIVTSGSYSDYRIVAAFTDKARAEKFLRAYNSGQNYDDVGIEEYEDGIPDDEVVFAVSLRVGDSNDDGSARATCELRPTGKRNEVTAHTYGTWLNERDRAEATMYTVLVVAEDASAAIKSGVEMIQRYRAETPGAR